MAVQHRRASHAGTENSSIRQAAGRCHLGDIELMVSILFVVRIRFATDIENARVSGHAFSRAAPVTKIRTFLYQNRNLLVVLRQPFLQGHGNLLQ